MSPEFFTPQDVADTIVGINSWIKNREVLYKAPDWTEVVNAMSRYAYKEIYDVVPSIDEGMYEYVEFSEAVDNVLRHECGSCVEDLIPENATNDDAPIFNTRFSEWRERAIETVSPEDESPEIREAVLYAMSIDTVVSFANRTLEQIDSALSRTVFTDNQKSTYHDLRKVWAFRSSFLETSRRSSMDLSGVL